jgi:hypothetical protein
MASNLDRRQRDEVFADWVRKDFLLTPDTICFPTTSWLVGRARGLDRSLPALREQSTSMRAQVRHRKPFFWTASRLVLIFDSDLVPYDQCTPPFRSAPRGVNPDYSPGDLTA